MNIKKYIKNKSLTMLLISFILIGLFNENSYTKVFKISDFIIRPTFLAIDENDKLYLYDEAKLELNKIDLKTEELIFSTKINFLEIDSFLIANDYMNKEYKCYNNRENNYGKLISLDYIRSRGAAEQVIKVESERGLKNLLLENNTIYSSGLVYLNFEYENDWSMFPDNMIFSLKGKKLKPYYIPKKNDIRKYLGKGSCLNNGTFYYINSFLDDIENRSYDKLLFKYHKGEFSYLPPLKNYKLDFKEFENKKLILMYHYNKLLICSNNESKIYDVYNDKVLLDLGDNELFSKNSKDSRGIYTNTKADIYNKYFASSEKYLFVHQWKKEDGKVINTLFLIKNDKIINKINFQKIDNKILSIVSIYTNNEKLYYLYLDKNEDYYIDDVDINKLLKL